MSESIRHLIVVEKRLPFHIVVRDIAAPELVAADRMKSKFSELNTVDCRQKCESKTALLRTRVERFCVYADRVRPLQHILCAPFLTD